LTFSRIEGEGNHWGNYKYFCLRFLKNNPVIQQAYLLHSGLDSIRLAKDFDDPNSQVPVFVTSFYSDPDYPMEFCRLSKPSRVSLMVMIPAKVGFLKT
jgi:hypothetical protein